MCVAGRRHRALAVAVLGVMAAAGYRAGRRASLAWGATHDEQVTGLAGDDYGRAPDVTATRAVTIRARPEDVWAWLVQIGRSRGGFYSYDWLENLVGLDIHSADRLEPQWAVLEEGDVVDLAEHVDLDVVDVRPGTDLVLRGAAPVEDREPPYDFVWSFHVRSGPRGTRLVVRERYWCYTSGARALVEGVQWVSLVMTRRMLHGIRERAEGMSRTPVTG